VCVCVCVCIYTQYTYISSAAGETPSTRETNDLQQDSAGTRYTYVIYLSIYVDKYVYLCFYMRAYTFKASAAGEMHSTRATNDSQHGSAGTS